MDATIDSDTAWAAFAARDRAYDGRFVVAVRSTHIYCKPSCAARRPHRDNVRFLADAAAARAAGYRACRRCLPDSVARDRAAVTGAATLLGDAATPPPLAALAAAVGYAPHHFHRLFRRLTGVTPAALARTYRADRALDAVRGTDSITAAIYDAGYAAPSRFYVDAARWGMTPHAAARAGAGERIGWITLATPLGTLLLARTSRGWCRFAFEDDDARLRAAFPAATIQPGDAALHAHAAALLARATAVAADASLPEPLRRDALRTLLHDAASG